MRQYRARSAARAGVSWRVHSGERIYEAAVRAAVPALRLAAPLNERLRRGVRGRRAALQSLGEWSRASRDRGRPLVWLHAPSVGEALMAQAILAETRDREPSIQTIFTHFSPSAERIAPRVGADWHGYLPWDRTADVGTALAATAPACIAFVRTEIWPVLGREAAARGSAVVMVNGVLAPDSSRLGRGARLLLGAAYRRLDAVGVVSEEDAACFSLLGIPRTKLSVTGDARFDQVWQRARRLDRDRPLLRPFRAAGRPWLVAGSTWPADDERIIDALARSRSWRCVIAPHEPAADPLAHLEDRLARAGLSYTRLPTDDDAGAVDLAVDVVVVDRVGVLADLYAIADLAYVGGGFGTSGLHSVVEPAALGVPVLYGPRHGNAREAERLRVAGGGFVIDDAAALHSLLARLFGDDRARAHAGAAARRFVEQHLGGAAASAELIAHALRG
ncbi:MAG TPA: glycosyltransferase N-terminal domain-containing protein [Longimicrobiales bacterium]